MNRIIVTVGFFLMLSLSGYTADENDSAEEEVFEVQSDIKFRNIEGEYYGRMWEQAKAGKWTNKDVTFLFEEGDGESGRIEYTYSGYIEGEQGYYWEEYSEYQELEEGHDGTFVVPGKAGTVTIGSVKFRWSNEEQMFCSYEYLIRIDKKEPLLDIAGFDSEKWYTEPVSVKISGRKDPVSSGFAHITAHLDGELIGNTAQAENKDKLVLVIDKEASSPAGIQLKVTAKDRCGNTTVMTKHIFIDSVSPKVSIAGIEDGGCYKQGRELLLKAEDNNLQLSGYLIERKQEEGWSVVDWAEYTAADKGVDKFYHIDEDGRYRVTVWAEDMSGNRAEKKCSFIIDQKPPELEILEVMKGHHYQSGVTPLIKITEESLDICRIEINSTRYVRNMSESKMTVLNEVINGESVIPFPLQQDGRYQLEVIAIDNAGNRSNAVVQEFIVDRESPVIHISGIEDGIITSKPVTLRYSYEEEQFQTARFEIEGTCRNIDGGEELIIFPGFAQTTNAEQVEGHYNKDGIYSFNFIGKDKAGNYAEQTKHMTIDSNSPVIRYIEELDGKYLKYFVLEGHISNYIEDLTIPYYELFLNEERFSGDGRITDEGKYVLRLNAKDEAGNKSWAQAQFIIDNTPPVICFAGVEDKKRYTKPVVVNVFAIDEKDQITEIMINGRSYEPDRRNEFLFEEEGVYEILVKAEDFAGNKREDTIQFTYKKGTAVFTGIIRAAETALAAISAVVAGESGTGILWGIVFVVMIIGGMMLRRYLRK